MWNIMKAQNYQTKKDNLTVYVLLFSVVIMLLTLLSQINFSLDGLNGGLATAYMGNSLFMILPMILLIFTSRICGWDAADKTMNYELLSGHSRKEVYFGRVLVSLLWSMASSMVLVILPVVLATIYGGWGSNMSFGDALLRYFLLLFPLFRLICEFVLLTFLLENCYKAMLIGWVLYDATFIGSMVYQEMSGKQITMQLVAANINYLFDFSNYKLQYIGGEDIPVFETALSTSAVAGTVIVSLLVGFLCLTIGYAVFCRRDMN